jgi:hypothetical protein
VRCGGGCALGEICGPAQEAPTPVVRYKVVCAMGEIEAGTEDAALLLAQNP